MKKVFLTVITLSICSVSYAEDKIVAGDENGPLEYRIDLERRANGDFAGGTGFGGLGSLFSNDTWTQRRWALNDTIRAWTTRILALSEAMLDRMHAKILEQKARHDELKNDVLQVETHWKKRDIHHKELLKKYEKQKDRMEARYQLAAFKLDMVKKLYELRKEEEKMRATGILPPRKPSRMIIMGKAYKNFEEFKKSPEYPNWRAQIVYQEALRIKEEKLEEIKLEQAIFNSAMRNPRHREAYLRNKVLRDSQAIQTKIKTDPIHRIERGEYVPFSEWPEHWKKNWRR